MPRRCDPFTRFFHDPVVNQPPSVQVLGEVDQAFDLPIPEAGVRLDADGVVDVGVGRHLAAPLRASPGFRRLDQRPADSPSPHVGIDVPALDVADRLSPRHPRRRAGSTPPRSRRARRPPSRRRRWRCPRSRSRTRPGACPDHAEEHPDVGEVLLVGAVGPEGSPHAEPFVPVLGPRGTDGVMGHAPPGRPRRPPGRRRRPRRPGRR